MIKDLIVVGAGACGLMGAIVAARDKKRVLILEKMPKVGVKLKATGGGRCNLTNSLDADSFMQSFGKSGRFMSSALEFLSSKELREFFTKIGVETDMPDGFRVFPVGHNSQTVLDALNSEIRRLGIEVKCSCEVSKISKEGDQFIVSSKNQEYIAKNILLATGGMGYPKLGSTGDGYRLAKMVGHTIKEPHPAMMPLKTKESWVANCRADTIANVTIEVDIKKYKKLKATGDLIFTKDGIRGPVVLDFSREITPLLAKYNEVPVVVKLTNFLHYDELYRDFKNKLSSGEFRTLLELVKSVLPQSVAVELILLSGGRLDVPFSKQSGIIRDSLIKNIVQTPLTIVGDNGFDMAMITRGGINLKEVDSKSMQSRVVKNLYFCGELLDLDGPCGGYNLQWAFSSGALAGKLHP